MSLRTWTIQLGVAGAAGAVFAAPASAFFPPISVAPDPAPITIVPVVSPIRVAPLTVVPGPVVIPPAIPIPPVPVPPVVPPVVVPVGNPCPPVVPPEGVPEPTTIVSAVLGLAALGAARRARKARPESA